MRAAEPVFVKCHVPNARTEFYVSWSILHCSSHYNRHVDGSGRSHCRFDCSDCSNLAPGTPTDIWTIPVAVIARSDCITAGPIYWGPYFFAVP